MISNFSQNTKNLLKQTSYIKSSLFSTKKSFNQINSVFERRSKIKSSIFVSKKLQNDRKLESLIRSEQRDKNAAISLSLSNRPKIILSTSSKPFLGRLFDFLSSVSTGWILINLPTWINWGENFIKRVFKLWYSMRNFVKSMTDFAQSLSTNFSEVITTITSFNFSDLPKTVDTGMKDLNFQFDAMTAEFEKGFALFKNLLIDDTNPDTNIPTQETPQEQAGTSVSPGSPGSTTTYSSTGGEKLTDPGGKDYGFYSPGAKGSRGSARAHGTGGQQGHTGEDYAMPTGTALTMIAPGTVVHAVKGDRYNAGYGEFVVVQLDDGRYVRLAHLDSINVKKGDKVGAGTGPNGTAKVIGRSGSTGLGSGPHLHLDVAKSYDSNSYMVSGTTDPKSFIDGGGLVKGGKVTATGEVTGPKSPAPPTSQPQETLIPSHSGTGTPGSGGKLKPIHYQALNIIAGPESGGDYNAMNNGTAGDRPGGSEKWLGKKLIDMTLGEVKYYQNIKKTLWAAGKYQFIPNTLPETIVSAGLRDTDLFDKNNQDLMAIGLVQKKGIQPWTVGGSKYSSKEMEIVEAAKTTPLGKSTSVPTITRSNSSSSKSLTSPKNGDVIFAEFPISENSNINSKGYGSLPIMDYNLSQSKSEVLNTFIKNNFLVQLSYL